MSRYVKDIHGDLADFASGKEVQCIIFLFIGLFCRERGLLAFWEGALSPPQKALPKSQKDFFRENELLK